MTAEYVKALVEAYPAVKEVWLIGSRANGTASPGSDWDYIAMADKSTLDALSSAEDFKVPDVDLLVVYDGENFRKPWPDGGRIKSGSLHGWEWNRVCDAEAVYKATKASAASNFPDVFQQAARRIFP